MENVLTKFKTFGDVLNFREPGTAFSNTVKGTACSGTAAANLMLSTHPGR